VYRLARHGCFGYGDETRSCVVAYATEGTRNVIFHPQSLFDMLPNLFKLLIQKHLVNIAVVSVPAVCLCGLRRLPLEGFGHAHPTC